MICWVVWVYSFFFLFLVFVIESFWLLCLGMVVMFLYLFGNDEFVRDKFFGVEYCVLGVVMCWCNFLLFSFDVKVVIVGLVFFVVGVFCYIMYGFEEGFVFGGNFGDVGVMFLVCVK